MKKIRTIEVPPVQKIITEVNDYFCDICTKFIGHQIYTRKNICAICKRHMHDNFKCGNDHPEHSQYDYPDHLCRICLDLYNELMLPLQQKNEAAEEAMLERIKRESLS